MALFKKDKPFSISLNNSFTSKVSGDFLNYEKGFIFSNTGEPYLNSGQSLDLDFKFLAIKVSPDSLLATGSCFLNGDVEPILNDKYNHTFIFKTDNLNGDFFFFKNPLDKSSLNGFLSKTDESYIISIGNGSIQGSMLNEDLSVYNQEIDIKRGGQLIFYANYDSRKQSFIIESSEEVDRTNQTSFQRDSESSIEQWDVGEFNAQIPICLVDFDRESVTNFWDNSITVSANGGSLGIDGLGYPTIS